MIFFIEFCFILMSIAAEVVQMGEANQDVVSGFICQERVSDLGGLLHWTPGRHLGNLPLGDLVNRSFVIKIGTLFRHLIWGLFLFS